MKTRTLAMCVSGIVALAAGSALAAPSNWWAPYTTDANTLGLWHFDDVTGPTGTFADSSGGAHNGTLSSYVLNGNPFTLTAPGTSGAGAGPGAGTFGKSLDFTPTQQPFPDNLTYDFGSVPAAGMAVSGAPVQFTIEAWIRPSSYDLSNNVYFVGNRNNGEGWNLGLLNGKLYFEATSTGQQYMGAVAPNALTADTWQHVAAVYIENETEGWNDHVHLYVNGVEVLDGNYNNVGFNGGIQAIGQPLIFGNRGTSTSATIYNGDIDEVRYSNIAREFGTEIPEPASLSLLALGGMAMLRRRRMA